MFSNNHYGTSFKAVEDVAKAGKVCMLDIDMQGVKNVKKSHLKARYIFLQPPSMTELERRLRGRGTESEENVISRLNAAKEEIEYAKKFALPPDDKIIINDDLEKAYSEFKDFIFLDSAGNNCKTLSSFIINTFNL